MLGVVFLFVLFLVVMFSFVSIKPSDWLRRLDVLHHLRD